MKISSVQLEHKCQNWIFSQNSQRRNCWGTFFSMILCVNKPWLRNSIDTSMWHRHFLISCMARVGETLFLCVSYHKKNCFKKKKKKWPGIKHAHSWPVCFLSSGKWKDTFLYTLCFSHFKSQYFLKFWFFTMSNYFKKISKFCNKV